ncbi:MAG: 3-dehydroquinate synthase [Candidatus Helarchaeota archaeon]
MINFIKNGVGYNKLLDLLNKEKVRSIVIICDSNSRKYCLEILMNELTTSYNKVPIIEMPSGENHKTLETCINIWKELVSLNFDKKTILINLGGGVVSDLGGFVGAVFKRGLKVINIPTTLLAMIDASIGGKNGVDFCGVKNVIGTITQPMMTVIDLRYLKTLNKRELKNGFAEMLKHALISDSEYWNNLINCDYNNLDEELVRRSIEIKEVIVKNDMYEKGKRKLLNFGHSIGHGIEAYYLMNKNSINLSHGEAVAAGIIMESYISMKLGLLDKEKFEIIKYFIKKIFGIIKIKENSFSNIIEFIRHDKKNINGELLFVLLEDIGSARFNIVVDEKVILDSLNYYNRL